MRSRAAIVDIGLRLREPLRAEVERAAGLNGVSMNQEMVRRLEESFRASEFMEILERQVAQFLQRQKP